MYWSTTINGFLTIAFILKFDWILSVRILELNVPHLADPRDILQLGCRFDTGHEELNSVKWYKDDQEFFRYSPRSPPLTFPVTGVHLSIDKTNCTNSYCSVYLNRLTTVHSSGIYRCEVSTERPAFRVASEAINVTIAALGQEDPKIDLVASTYVIGEMVYANCTTAASDPIGHITWLINNKPAPANVVSQPRISKPNQENLATKSILLRFPAEKRHFIGQSAAMELKCVVNMPGLSVPARNNTAVSVLRDLTMSNQKLAWPSSSGLKAIHPENRTLKLMFVIMITTVTAAVQLQP